MQAAPSGAASAPPRVGLLTRLSQAAIDPRDDDETRLRKTLLLLASGLMNVAAFIWLAIYWWMGLKLSTTIPILFQLASVAVLIIYLRTRNFDFFRVAQLSLFLFFPFVIQWSIGNFVSSSGIGLLALLAPVGAVVVYGRRDSIPWFVAYVVFTVVSGVFDFLLLSGKESGIPMRTVAVFFVLNFTIVSTMVYLLLNYFVRERDKFQVELGRQHELIRLEREKSDRLLYNVLPGHVADRLKLQSGTIADGFADVSVMFADIVNFTQLAENLAPNQVVSYLDTIFTRIDELAIHYGVDKIKTIGDAYMVAGGLDNRSLDYPERVADLALHLIEIARSDPELTRHHLSFHIGIATGPVVAGVIGATRFLYDLWGDTVNVSARLMGEAPSGSIVVDQVTYRRLGNRFTFDQPVEINAKGKGVMTVYPLLGRRIA